MVGGAFVKWKRGMFVDQEGGGRIWLLYLSPRRQEGVPYFVDGGVLVHCGGGIWGWRLCLGLCGDSASIFAKRWRANYEGTQLNL